MFNFKTITAAIAFSAQLASAIPAKRANSSSVAEISCNSQSYKYKELAGYGFVKPNAVDKFGDTLGGIGSSLAIEKGSWKLRGSQYEAIFWALPDRGWNTKGTLNYQNRVHKFKITFDPSKTGSANLDFNYFDTILLFGPDGQPTTGLDADAIGSLQYPGFPNLPAATYPGDGYGSEGPGGKRISLDAEGLVLGKDGTFWITDEYGPYLYQFDPAGKMISATRPPDAYIPIRNGTESFNSDTPPFYDQERQVIPADPTAGRANNQGFEGFTISPDGKTLAILAQSALIQEGGTSSKDRLNARLLRYDISSGSKEPKYLDEYVVSLPQYTNNEGKKRVAAQSEILQVSEKQFLVLARDGQGRGEDFSQSLYRHADVFDISSATNIKGDKYDKQGGAIANKDGKLVSGVTAAKYCSFVDYNVNSELAKFGLQNGGAQDETLLNAKWESLALAPVKGARENEYYLFSISDNDFITTDGHLRFGTYDYQDDLDLNSQALVFKITLPKGFKPYGC